MTSRWDHMGNSVRGLGPEGDPVAASLKIHSRWTSGDRAERDAADDGSAGVKFQGWWGKVP